MSYHPFFPKRFLVDDIGTYDTLYSFLCEFFLFGFSYKVFDEAMSTKVYAMSSSFPPPGFWKMIFEAY